MTAHPAPDPGRGVFETLLVLGGAPVEAEAHLARLGASLRSVYGAGLPAGVRGELRAAARGAELGRLRLTARPGGAVAGASGGEPAIAVEIGALDPRDHFPPRPLTLRPLELPGGLGAHKWADRSALAGAADGGAAGWGAADGAEPLLVDRSEVLEAGRANVFALLGGALVTPPLDGRILPGIARAAAIEEARAAGLAVRERPLGLAELRRAEAILLTNSLRGVQPGALAEGRGGRRDDPPGARTGGAPLPAPARLLAARLRERWRRGAARAAPAAA